MYSIEKTVEAHMESKKARLHTHDSISDQVTKNKRAEKKL